jgi:hypothetical protein
MKTLKILLSALTCMFIIAGAQGQGKNKNNQSLVGTNWGYAVSLPDGSLDIKIELGFESVDKCKMTTVINTATTSVFLEYAYEKSNLTIFTAKATQGQQSDMTGEIKGNVLTIRTNGGEIVFNKW